MQQLKHIESTYHHCFLDLLLLFYHLGESIYDPPQFRLILRSSQYNT